MLVSIRSPSLEGEGGRMQGLARKGVICYNLHVKNLTKIKMKNPLCFSCFSNGTKPNRLIFKEEPPKGPNSLPNIPTDSEEKIQGSHTLSYERVLALESFRRKMFEKNTDFVGDDSNKTEKAQNEVFQYLYEKLDKLFRAQTSTEWPLDRQREWMDLVTNYIIGVIVSKQKSFSDAISKEEVDDLIPSHVLDIRSRSALGPGVGSFPIWFSRNYPVEYQKIFGKDVKKD